MTEILNFDADVQRDIFGSKDHHVRKIEKDLNVSVIARDGVIKVTGEDLAVRKAVGILENLHSVIQSYKIFGFNFCFILTMSILL